MSETTDLATLRQQQPALPVTAGFFDSGSFELMQRVSKAFASSTLVPKEYQGNVANTMIALNLAQRIGADPLMVMQNLYVVHGRPGWSSQFLIASFNRCGRFTALRYEFVGERNTDGWGCRAWAVELSTKERINGAVITIGLARKEGWYGKQGSKWQTMPEQMLMYRAASWLVRAYAPEIAMGLPTSEELVDTFDARRDANGAFAVSVEDLREPVAVPEPVAEEAPAAQPQDEME